MGLKTTYWFFECGLHQRSMQKGTPEILVGFQIDERAFLDQDIFFMTLTKILLAELPRNSLPPSTRHRFGYVKTDFPNPEKNYL